MADSTRELSQEYWRPAHATGNFPQGHGFQQSSEAFCAICGTQYAVGARFCHVCGLGRESDLRDDRRSIAEWLDVSSLGARLGLTTISLVFVVAASVFMLATVMMGIVYDTSTVAEWQAVQTWRIEWLLATTVSLLAAILFKAKP